MDLKDLIMDAYKKPDPKPYLFEVGQIVRIRKFVIEDGQTPLHWAGAKATVEHRWTTGLHKDHIYKLKLSLPDGLVVCEFKEYELDMRFCKKS